MEFYPAGVRPPDMLRDTDFLLRPLRSSDVDLDYEAVMEDPAALRLSGGGSWPADDFTLAANLTDLIMHEREHDEGVAFTYTVMNLDQSECLGCVYVNQLSSALQVTSFTTTIPVKVDNQQAIVRFWVRHSRLSDELDWRLLNALVGWFSERWLLSQFYFRAHHRDERQKGLMQKAGLPLVYSLEVSDRRGPFLAYGPVLPSGEEKRQ